MAAEHTESPPDAPAGVPSACATADVLCVRCGYNLQRLSIDLNCPECGCAIRESLEGHRLAGAEPRWLRRVVRGSGFLAWGWLLVIAAPITVIGLVLLTTLMFVRGGGTGVATLLGISMLVLGFAFLAGLVLIAIGTILATMQDPRESLREAPLSARRIGRIGLVGAVLAYLSMLPAAAFFRITMAGEIVSYMLGSATLLLLTAGIVGLLHTLAMLIERVPDAKRARNARLSARFVLWALPIAVVLQVLTNFAGNAGSDPSHPLWLLIAIIPCALLIVWILILIWGIRLAVLLFQARAMFRAALLDSVDRGTQAAS